MRHITLTVLAMLTLLTAASPVAAQGGRDLFQQALVKERADGDLRGAIALYERIARDFTSDRQLAASALVQLGQCQEKLGMAEAERAYQRVVSEFADQGEVTAQARTRLAALRSSPATGRGPVARRLLSEDETDINNLFIIRPSPDGRRVAYVDLVQGTLYLRELATGTVERLLPGAPAVFNLAPVWSPDGKRLAFMEIATAPSMSTMKIIDLASHQVTSIAGTQRPRGSGTDIGPMDWSRDGRQILFRVGSPNGSGAIGIVPSAGGALTMLNDSVPGSAQGTSLASLSPDGRWVTYHSGPRGSEQVVVQAVSGGAKRQITQEQGGNALPLWSPDGRAIAFQRKDGIWLIPVENGQPAGTPRLAYASTSMIMPNAWTDAGLYITLYSENALPYQLPVDPASGEVRGTLEELPHHPATFSSFAWSPDRQRVAFLSRVGDEITIYGDGGSSITSFRPGEGEVLQPRQFAWSADGRELRYGSNRRDAGRAIMALDPATRRTRELFPRSVARAPVNMSADGRFALYVHTGSDTTPAGLAVAERGQAEGRLLAPEVGADGAALGTIQLLSPNGDLLLFSRRSSPVGAGGVIVPDAASLWVLPRDGSAAPRRLGTAPSMVSAAWDPSGRFVAYTGMVSENKSVLRIVDVATGNAREVPLPKTSAGQVRVADWSADGRFIGLAVPAYRAEYWVIQGLQARPATQTAR